MIQSEISEVFDQVVDLYNVRIPTYVLVSKKNQKAVNLNVYRNLHHHHLNTQKKNFEDEVMPLLRGKPQAERVWIHYTIYASSNRRLDTMNVGSIADKYFSDTMVKAGKIPDDNGQHVVLVTFSFGGLSKMDGHAIATVHILEKPQKEKEPESMRILLDQDDIQNALNAYAKSLQLPNAGDAEVELSIEDNEIVAEVILGEAPVKNKGGRPRKTIQKMTTKKPEVTEDDAEESADSDDEGSSDDADSGSGDASETEAETGEKTTAETSTKKASKEKAAPKGNLFGDEDDQSSDSATTEDSPPKTETVVKPVKKSSIFDVD